MEESNFMVTHTLLLTLHDVNIHITAIFRELSKQLVLHVYLYIHIIMQLLVT